MRRNYAQLCLSVFIALALFAIPAFPQSETTGTVTGRAQDISGALIPGVEVTIASPAMMGGARSAVTDETGTYRFTLLPPGTYRVTFALSGFKTLNVDGVNVTPAATSTQNGLMQVASASEEITVTSQAPAIDLEAATVGVNWDIHKLEDLPYARSLTALNAMLPGVYFTGTYDVGGSQFGTGSAVGGKTFGRGGGGTSNNGNNVMAIDGLVWCQGYADYGSFEEVNFTTASKGADQGNAGVTMEMIVKSGGNQFHGNFTQSYERGAWHPFGQATNIDQDLLGRGLPPGSNKFVSNRQTWGDIGGPILKDKFWFYFAYLDGQLNQYVPGYISFKTGAPAVFLSRLENPTGKLTYQLNTKMKLEASWPLNLKTQPYRNGNNRIPLEATQNQHSWATYGPNLKWTYIIDAKTTATASLNRGGYWWPDVAWSGAPANSLVTEAGILPTLDNANDVRRVDLTTNATLGPQLAIYRRPIRWTGTGAVSRFQAIGGKNNEIKIGYTDWWTKNYTTNFGYPNQQVYQYQSLPNEDYTVPTPQNILGVFQHPSRVQIFDYPNTTISAFTYKALYFNDKINLTRKFTLTAGVRMDRYNSWLPAQGRKGLGPAAIIPANFATAFNYPEITSDSFPVETRFVPRFSLAYDVKGDGKLALKASYGRYTAYTSGINSPLQDASNVSPNSTTTCTYLGWNGLVPFVPTPGNYTSFSCSGGGGAGTVRSDGVAFNASDATTWPKRLSKSLDSDYLDEFTAGADIGLNRDMTVRFSIVRKFDYARNKFLDLAQPMEAWTDERCHNYNAATNSVTAAASNNLIPSGDANSGIACVWSVPASNPNQGKINQLVVNNRDAEAKSQFTAYEVAFNKQDSHGWSFLASYDVSMSHLNPNDPQNPNELYYRADNKTLQTTSPYAAPFTEAFYGPPTWDQAFKMNGTYELPLGFQWASTFSAQSGQWLNRGVQVRNALGANVIQVVASHVDRLPWVNLWDQRFTKKFKIGDRQQVEAYYELFNTMNLNTITQAGSTLTTTLNPSGTAPGFAPAIGTAAFIANNNSLYRPNAIVSPRISQFTIKYRF